MLALLLCDQAGFEPTFSQEVGDAATGVALVASGFGVCLVAASATTLLLPGVLYRPVSEAPKGFCVDLSYMHRAGNGSPILQGLLVVIEVFRAGLPEGVR